MGLNGGISLEKILAIVQYQTYSKLIG